MKYSFLKTVVFFVITFALVSCGAINGLGGFIEPQRELSADFSDYVTFGEKSLLEENGTTFLKPEKNRAIDAISRGNFGEAIKALKQYRDKNPKNLNDPEALIFLNNAISANDDNVYKIAVSVPISDNPDASKEILRGVAHAQEELNCHGEGGSYGNGEGLCSRSEDNIKFRVAIVNDGDDGSDDSVAKVRNIAQVLANQDDILGVVGPYSSDASKSTYDIYEASHLVVVSPISTSTELTNISDYYFRTVPNDKDAAIALADYAKENVKEPKAIIFYNSDSDYSISLKREFIAALGSSNVISQKDPDFDFNKWQSDDQGSYLEYVNKALKKAKEESVNIIMLAPSSKHLEKAIEVLHGKGDFYPNSDDVLILGGDDTYSEKTLSLGQKDANKMVIAVAWHIDKSKSGFPETSKILWGTPNVNWRTITAYDAFKSIYTAIKEQKNPTRRGVQEVISSRDFGVNGAMAGFHFKRANDGTSSGDYSGSIQLVKVNSDQRFVPID